MELFANPWFLVYFIPAALLVWLVAWSGKKLKNRLIAALFGPQAYQKLTANLRPVTWKRGACFGLFLFFLFVALAGPQWGTEVIEVQGSFALRPCARKVSICSLL